uniref:hypothetical protein n=1 Tax=Azospirillum argentinense TaxID=2970906 RepID=UPI0010C0436E|nr:hypothetical protein [Azospirillum argentinense]
MRHLLDMLKRGHSLFQAELPEAQPMEAAVELICHALQEAAMQAQSLAENRNQWAERIEKIAARLCLMGPSAQPVVSPPGSRSSRCIGTSARSQRPKRQLVGRY